MASSKNFSVGIDIGSYNIKVIVAEQDSKNENHAVRILGTSIVESKGVRHGFIINTEEAVKSLKVAISQAEKSANVTIRRAYASVGGMGLSAIISYGGVSVTKADSEITDLDIRRVIDESEKELPNSYIQNRKIIHTVPLEYKVDGKRVLGKPFGLKGVRLEVKVLYITCLSHHLSDLLTVFDEADIEVQDVIAAPIAASIATLTKTQKIAGCVLTNIGSETTSIMVFENNMPVSMEVFQIGSNDITNDIALGLKISLEDAEQIKLGQGKIADFPKRKLDEIIVARLSDIFDLIDDHLRKIDRSGLLPAGIILTGGGTGVANMEELAKIALRLPAKQSQIKFEGNTRGILHDFEWTVPYGLVLANLTPGETDGIANTGIKTIKSAWQKLIKWLSQFLP
jgi:cell division protein FtsA